MSLRRRPPVETGEARRVTPRGVGAAPPPDGTGTQLSGGPVDDMRRVGGPLTDRDRCPAQRHVERGHRRSPGAGGGRRGRRPPLRLPAPEQVLEGSAAHHRAAPRDLLPHRPEPPLGRAAHDGRDRGPDRRPGELRRVRQLDADPEPHQHRHHGAPRGQRGARDQPADRLLDHRPPRRRPGHPAAADARAHRDRARPHGQRRRDADARLLARRGRASRPCASSAWAPR